MVYGFSLMVLARSERWQASAALVKGAFMLVFGLAVLTEAGYKIWHPTTLGVETMGVIGLIALAANCLCFVLLHRHRSDNLNMSSTWLCSRNDVLANIGVLVAAVVSYSLSSYWPDVIVGVAIAILFLGSAITVLQQAVKALNVPPKTKQSSAFKPVTIARAQEMNPKD